jgi:hypothetical protein
LQKELLLKYLCCFHCQLCSFALETSSCTLCFCSWFHVLKYLYASLLGLLSGLIDNVKWFPGQLISFWLQSQCDFEEWDVHIFYIHHGNFSPQAEFDRCGLKIFNDRELCSPWNLLLEVLSVLP